MRRPSFSVRRPPRDNPIYLLKKHDRRLDPEVVANDDVRPLVAGFAKTPPVGQWNACWVFQPLPIQIAEKSDFYICPANQANPGWLMQQFVARNFSNIYQNTSIDVAGKELLLDKMIAGYFTCLPTGFLEAIVALDWYSRPYQPAQERQKKQKGQHGGQHGGQQQQQPHMSERDKEIWEIHKNSLRGALSAFYIGGCITQQTQLGWIGPSTYNIHINQIYPPRQEQKAQTYEPPAWPVSQVAEL